ncbi:3'(2'), 5'-bisphosphate nucleotidase [Pseudomonas flavescens]|uniref:3'(2'),5'-bisphosphate nucleotidase CysQ n=1 Tax=Phytopseudomonas flavescens TaxID=29435 RepID=A0A1G8LRS4_9GAMM|nr:3'(2'),5'-bisphosphate nucleotidase CysQ [Pseudomonas flavescens]SDI57890.1 3'(2'), 5'-bisphosphate nucleotidase [Pseudomonas flavescens]
MSHPLLPAVLALVQQAGAAILPFWRQGVQVVEKADASPVTAADLAAHRVLADGLQALDASIPVLSEEDADIALSERALWARWWLVDPLDGTKEFIADSEEFTVNVALIEDGQVVFGVVGIPASGVVYYGGSGLGAWRAEPGDEPQAIAVRETPASGLTVVASRRHGSALQEQLLAALVARFGDIDRISVGSSLKFCQLAEGSADFYPRLAPTSQWDTAAAQGVLEGAGGVVLTLHGEPLRYEARESLLNPFFLALPADVEWRAVLVEQAKRLTPAN